MAQHMKTAQMELEALHEAKIIADEHKKELLEHNALLAHPPESEAVMEASKEEPIAQPVKEKLAAPPVYIKKSEDRERIAKNTFNSKAMQAPKPSSEPVANMVQSNFNQIFDLQSKFLHSWLENWSNGLNLLAPKSRKK